MISEEYKMTSADRRKITLTDKKVRNLVCSTIEEIAKSRTLEDLNKIYSRTGKKLEEENTKYPKLNFKISKEEIEKLECLTLNDSFENSYFNKERSTVEKLFYATLWKNGDLSKIKHIINGIKGDNNKKTNSGIVFFQFGQFLNSPNEPIIDQNIIRVFGVYKANLKEVNKLRKLSTVRKKHEHIIADYKKWLDENISSKLKKIPEYKYYIDKILFEVGKSIKIK